MSTSAQRGFEGSVTAMSVADLLQLQGHNRFSGSIAFFYEGLEAVVFMQHGEVVHAECGDLRGEPVIGQVLAWPTGAFEAHANVATFARTIEKRLDHLLLDAARVADEARRDGVPPPRPRPGAAPARTPAPAAPTALARIRAVDGVTCAALLKDGVAQGDQSPEAAALAARSAFLLSMIANPVGKALGLGEVGRAALATAQGEQLLLLHAKDGYLAVAARADVTLLEVEGAVRRAVAGRPGA